MNKHKTIQTATPSVQDLRREAQQLLSEAEEESRQRRKVAMYKEVCKLEELASSLSKD